jgi:putative oxidoreductase
MNFGVIPQSFSPVLLSVFRIAAGLACLEHGTGKLLTFPVLPGIHEMMPAGLLYFTGIVEFVGGLLMTLGLFTRPTAFVLSGFMAFAYFMAHFPRSFFPALSGGEPALLYCFGFLYLAAAGAGPISLDAVFGVNAGARSSASRNAAAA